jgi:hypothetical protein
MRLPFTDALAEGLAWRFGIPITAHDLLQDMTAATGDAPGEYTAGHVHEFVWRHLAGGLRRGRMDALVPLFRELREALVRVSGVPPRSVRPSTRLDEILPRTGRWQTWLRLGEALGTTLPALEVEAGRHRPRAAAVACLRVLLAVPLYAVVAVSANWVEERLPPGRPWWVMLLLGVFLSALYLAVLPTLVVFAVLPLYTPLLTRLPADCQTVRDLIRRAHPQRPRPEREVVWTRATVWLALRRDLAEYLGGNDRLGTREARLIADLGLGWVLPEGADAASRRRRVGGST